MFFLLCLCLNETTSFSQTPNYLVVLRSWSSPFLLTYASAFFYPSLSRKNLWGSCHSPILFSIIFMRQLSIYCVSVPNPPFAVRCDTRTRPYKHSSLPASTALDFVNRGHSKATAAEDSLIRVPVLHFKIHYRNSVVLKDQFQLYPQATLFPSDSSIKFLCHRQPVCSCDSHTLFNDAEFQPGVGGEALS